MIQPLTDLRINAGNNYPAQRILSELNYLIEIFTSLEQPIPSDVLGAINELNRSFITEGAITLSMVYSCEASLSKYISLAKSYHLLCAAHAHIDMNWMWGTDETTSIIIDTFQTMLNLMDEYPDFIFSQSQAATYAIIEEYCPDLLPEIRKRVREGRWEVTASTWVEEDQNMSSTESIVRHLMYTKQYLSSLLEIDATSLNLDFEPDTFGHGAHLPMLLRQGGVKYFYYCRGFNYKHAFRWRSPSGDEVIAFCEPGWYQGAIEYDMIGFLPKWCRENGLSDCLKVYGVGDHGGGPTRRDIERIMDMATWPLGPEIAFSTMQNFFTILEKNARQLPIIEKELNFIFPGCYTSQSRLKKANRHSEDHLFDAEALSSMAILANAKYPNPKSFSKAWKKVLFNQFHDILPGSCIRESREFALGAAQEVGSYAIGNANRALYALGQLVDTLRFGGNTDKNSPSEGAGVGYGAAKSSHMEREYVGTDFNFTSAQRGSGTIRAYTIFNTTAYDRNEVVEITVWDWPLSLEDTIICDAAGNQIPFIALLPRQEYWRHQFDKLSFVANVPSFGFTNYYIMQAENPCYQLVDPEPREITRGDDGYILENNQLRATFASAGCKLISLFDKKTQRELLSEGVCFRLIQEEEDQMSSWIVGNYANIQDLNEEEAVQVLEYNSNGITQWLTYAIRFKRSLLEVRVSLATDSTIVRFSINCDFQEIGGNGFIPQLQFFVPYSYTPKSIRCDTPGGMFDRPELPHDIPIIRYCTPVPETGSAIILTTDCKYGVRAWDSSLILPLLRGSTAPDRYPEQGIHQFEIGLGASDTVESQDLNKLADCFSHPLYPYSNSIHHGILGQSKSFLRISGGRVTSLKPSESGDGVVLRILNESNETKSCSITSPFVITHRSISFTEQVIEKDTSSISPQSISTFLLKT